MSNNNKYFWALRALKRPPQFCMIVHHCCTHTNDSKENLFSHNVCILCSYCLNSIRLIIFHLITLWMNTSSNVLGRITKQLRMPNKTNVKLQMVRVCMWHCQIVHWHMLDNINDHLCDCPCLFFCLSSPHVHVTVLTHWVHLTLHVLWCPLGNEWLTL